MVAVSLESGNLLRWITLAFLSGRRQEVVLNGYHSRLISVTSGVPQGSVLGPLLFIIVRCPEMYGAEYVRLSPAAWPLGRRVSDIPAS